MVATGVGPPIRGPLPGRSALGRADEPDDAGAMATRPVDHRPRWQSVAIPREHGGWGLTIEPVLLGLVVAWSWEGLLIGLAALWGFLMRTPAKLAGVDARRGQWRERSALATRIAVIEAVIILTLVGMATISAGWRWWLPLLIAGPLVAIELWFDLRSRSRRLVPELCGAVGVAAAAGAVVLAADDDYRLAFAAWLVLAARAIMTIPFVRAQIMRARRGLTDTRGSDIAQVAGLAVAAAAVAIEPPVWPGAALLVLIAAAEVWWARHDPPPVKVIGLRQMGLGFAVVAATAAGVLAA